MACEMKRAGARVNITFTLYGTFYAVNAENA
jgi:hypothetical protein